MRDKLFILFLAVLLVGAIGSVSAQQVPQITTCCEKTTYGAWCQNSLTENCDSGFRTTPTSCDATSFCKQGCCYDSKEGVCMENTPQRVCEQSNGTWADSASCEIPQCNLGCCVLDNQAAFVTLVRCKKLSASYGLQTNFRLDVQSETACVALAQAEDRGACVYEEEFTKTCKFTTRSECEAMKGKRVGNYSGVAGNISFHKDFLCTAEELATNCGMTDKTTCIDGKDEVYFVDSCGNPANIYDASKVNEKAYWRKIVQKKDSCGFSSASSSANSPGCGNCDYFGGSFCRKYDGKKDSARPTYGDFICRDLNCKSTVDGKSYKHGESWCIYDSATGNGKDLAGSRQWKHICIAGEELIEPCADLRQEICIQDKITTDKGVFQQAACRPNRWQECAGKKTPEDCNNLDKGDCMWIEGVFGQDNFGVLTTATQSQAVVQQAASSDDSEEKKVSKLEKHGVCVPNYPPGLQFWTAGEAEGICTQGNSICEVEYEKTGFIGGSKKCITNCECLQSSWKQTREGVCEALGDCVGDGGTVKKGVWSVLSGGFGVSGTG